MKNKEKFEKEILKLYLNGGGVAFNNNTNKLCNCNDIDCGYCKFYDESLHCYAVRRKWANEEYVEQILTDKEKEYLSAVIKPFRDKVGNIAKWRIDDEFIEINLTTQTLENIKLPYFEKGTMYKGMKNGKKYTLEELGI